MRKVFKYRLGKKTGIHELEVPRGGVFISCGQQSNEFLPAMEILTELVVWADVDDVNIKVTRQILVIFTGQEFPRKEVHKFLGTQQIGDLVYHIYELRNENSVITSLGTPA